MTEKSNSGEMEIDRNIQTPSFCPAFPLSFPQDTYLA